MKLLDFPFQQIDWDAVEPVRHPGASGFALWRTRQMGEVRVRRVDYSAGYEADHWCAKGHVLFVLEGELRTELRDGRSLALQAGQGYLVADGDGEHRSSSAGGARLFIVD